MIRPLSILFASFILAACSPLDPNIRIQTITAIEEPSPSDIWLSHEHILVDFIGADSINRKDWNQDTVMQTVLPFLEALKEHKVRYYVDATPAYLGRDVLLLKEIALRTGLRIITNTGYYGARKNKYIPSAAFDMTPHTLADIWIAEFEHGIDNTTIKPGFIKIGVDASDSFDNFHKRLVHAAAITHLKTGMSIASHTGEAKGLWPQLDVLGQAGVAAQAFIWVHAQQEKTDSAYLKAARQGCWISFDGLGWELDEHVKKILFAKENNILDQILISHDAGWYDPQKKEQSIVPYTDIFTKLIPRLEEKGFTEGDITLLLSANPANAFNLKVRRRHNPVH